MRDEINNYNITNPDGVSLENFDSEKKISFSNDDHRSVAEDSSTQIDEWDRSVSEDSSSAEKTRPKGSDETGGTEGRSGNNGDGTGDLTSSSATSSVSGSITAGTTSISSALSGAMGALAGVVATTVVAVLVIAIAFVSTMTINVSLSMAEMTRFIFHVEIKNAQEEDFLVPVMATLEGDGYFSEQEVLKNTVYLTFEGLESGKEYTLKIYNEEKTFVKKSFITATEDVDHGFIEAFVEDDEAVIFVKDVALKKGEYYTLTVKDADGNVVFVKDSADATAEYRVALSGSKDLYYTITVNGAVYALAKTQAEIEPDYDFANGSWSWTEDESASISFDDKNGGEPLVVAASVTRETILKAACETEGSEKLTATATYEGVDYTDEKTVVIAALEHDFGELIAEEPATCEETGMAAHYHCEACDKFFDEDKNEVTEESLVIAALGHTYGELIAEEPATCEETGVAAHYHCEACGKFFDEDKNEVTEESLVIAALGHTYGELIAEEPATCEETGMAAHYHCEACGKFFDEEKNEVTEESLAIAALGHTYGELIAEEPATCEETGIAAHYHCEACGKFFDEDKNEVTEESLVIAALGHTYGELIAEEPATCEEGGIAAHYECSVCHKVFDENKVETTLEALAVSALGHAYGELIEENHDGNGLAAHYECLICHKLFDEDKAETTAEALALGGGSQACEISLDEGAICINPNGYARSESGLSNPTPFVSSATNPYLIKNQEINWCDNIIQVYQNDSSIETADIYIKLSNVTIEAGNYCSLFLIKATRTINIHLIIEGTVTFVGGWDQQVFSSQGSGSPTVNIIIDQTTAGGTFNAQAEDGLTYAQSGTINVSYV